MPVSESFVTFVVEQLAGLPAVSTRRMFGGVGLYGADVFFGVIDNDTLFFKVDAATGEKYRQRGMGPFQPIPGKPPMNGYYQVPADVLEDPVVLAAWAAESVALARTPAPPARPPGPRARRPRRP